MLQEFLECDFEKLKKDVLGLFKDRSKLFVVVKNRGAKLEKVEFDSKDSLWDYIVKSSFEKIHTSDVNLNDIIPIKTRNRSLIDFYRIFVDFFDNPLEFLDWVEAKINTKIALFWCKDIKREVLWFSVGANRSIFYNGGDSCFSANYTSPIKKYILIKRFERTGKIED